MLDKKRKFFRLLELYINESQKESVESMYGKNSKIKIHNWTYTVKGDKILFELVIILGDVINESVMDTGMAEILLKDALVYFYPEIENINCMVRFDV